MSLFGNQIVNDWHSNDDTTYNYYTLISVTQVWSSKDFESITNR
jgi:hypothetical protein